MSKAKLQCVAHVGAGRQDADSLWRKLTAIPYTPASLRNTFPKEKRYVQRFMEIVTSPRAVEVDWLVLCGDLTLEQASQYCDASGDHDICANQLTQLAIDIADEFRPRLIELINRETLGNKKEGINNLFARLLQLPRARAEPIKELSLFNFHLGENFLRQAMAIIGSDLIDILESDELNQQSREVVRSCLSNGDAFCRDVMGSSFMGFQYHDERSVYHATLNEGRFRSEGILSLLDGAMDFPGQYDAGMWARVYQEVMADLDYVRREVVYKKIPPIVLKKRWPQIIVAKDNPDRMDYPYSPMCTVRINFSPLKSIGFPEHQETSNGKVFYDYGIHLGIVNCFMNPVSGDLCFITSKLPLRGLFSEDRYLALQHYVLRKLREYLENKEPDVEDLFLLSNQELKGKGQQEPEASAKDDGELRCEPLEVLCEAGLEQVNVHESLWQHVPFQKRRDSPDAEPLLTEEPVKSLPKHFRTAVMRKISGAGAEETLAAFRRMMGNEERVRGSHHFFRSRRNNVILPVPNHSHVSGNHIAFKLILSNLKGWGYSPMELAEELGMDISERIHS